jgi:hypothetical protein
VGEVEMRNARFANRVGNWLSPCAPAAAAYNAGKVAEEQDRSNDKAITARCAHDFGADASLVNNTHEARAYRSQYTRPIEIKVGKNHKRLLNLYDPDGLRVELMEPNTIDGKPVPPSEAPLPKALQKN